MLFKDTIKLKEYAEFTGDINFASVKKTVRIVEETHLIPILGYELYNTINNTYTVAASEADLSYAQRLLLDKCRMIIGPYVLYNYTPKAELRVNDAGARRAETQTEKTAYKYQVDNFREQALQDAEAAIESLLQFLEIYKDDFSQWATSTAFTDYRGLFIRTGSEFANLVKTHSPFRNYWAMRSKMVDVEENNIRKALGNDLYKTLKDKSKSPEGTFTEKENDLLFKIKKATAYFTVAFSIPHLNVRIDANGISVVATSFSTDVEARAAANDKALNAVISSAHESGNAWLKNTIDFLNNNPADFPQWTVVDTSSNDSINTDLNGSFGLV